MPYNLKSTLGSGMVKIHSYRAEIWLCKTSGIQIYVGCRLPVRFLQFKTSLANLSPVLPHIGQ